MNRTIGTVKLEHSVRHKVRIESEPCAKGSPEARLLQYRYLEQLGQVQDLTLCGTVPFTSFVMWHDGEKWVVEAEATVPK